jgi:transposase
MIFIGINISKLTFDAAYSLNSRTIHKQFSNNPKGFGEFSLWLNKNKKELYTCLEATSIYSNEIVRIKKSITTLVKSNQILTQQVDLLVSINGIGERTAWSILAYIGDINFFSNSKQIASYAGLTPKIISKWLFSCVLDFSNWSQRVTKRCIAS